MRYEIPNVPMFCQRQTMSCWYASAMMLLRWRQRSGTLFEPPQATNFPEFDAHLIANDGLPHARMLAFAQQLGLQAVPRLPHLPNPVELQTWLMMFGPLWTDGVPVNTAGQIVGGGHVVVIGGVDDRAEQMLVLDPGPVNVGTRGWRPYAQLGQILSQRNDSSRPVTFLHYPPRQF